MEMTAVPFGKDAVRFGELAGVDRHVSRIVLGTMALGLQKESASFELFDAAYAAGINAFDTAHVYGEGASDRLLGAWLSRSGLREDVVLITKGGAPEDGEPRVSPEHLRVDLEESLDRLSTDYADCFLVHVDDEGMPVERIVDELELQRRSGRIRSYGMSNWSLPRMQHAQRYAEEIGGEIAVSSLHFSLARQVVPPWPGNLSLAGPAAEAERRWYETSGIAVLAWSSLAGGFFSGRIRRDNLDTCLGYFEERCRVSYAAEENFERFDRAAQIAGEQHATVARVALAYVLLQSFQPFAIVGCLSLRELEDTIGAWAVVLSERDRTWMNLSVDSRSPSVALG